MPQKRNYGLIAYSVALVSNNKIIVAGYAVVANHTDLTSGFVSATDTVVKLQNYQSGSLAASSFI